MSTTQTQAKQPDISYHPDFEKYQLRSEKIQALLPPDSKLPVGFPSQLSGPLVWEGKDFPDEKQWTIFLNEQQLEEIHQALIHFKALDKPIAHVSRDTFPLRDLSPILRQEAKVLLSGRGFFVLRGIPVDKYSIEDNVIIYTGVSSYIGSIRGRQDKTIVDGIQRSQVLNHIKDLTQTAVASNIGAPAYTTDKQVFHTDVGDIVSLFALNTAFQGGESKLASSWRVYNELAKNRPDIIKTLSEDWVFSGYGNGSQNGMTRPILHYTPATPTSFETVIIQYARRFFTGFLHLPRSTDIPPITEQQAEALDALHFLAERFSLTLNFQKGDIQYINNLSIFHARDSFTDTTEQQRHLLRLWLRDPENAWATPEPLKYQWDALYKDITPEEQVFPLEPKIRSGSGKV